MGEKGWTESLSFLCPEGYGKADVSEGRVEYVKRLSVGVMAVQFRSVTVETWLGGFSVLNFVFCAFRSQL